MLAALQRFASKSFSLADKELSALEELHSEARATIDRFQAQDPDFKQLLRDAHAYAVFPSIGKAAAVLGVAFGKGEVFEAGKLIGYAAMGQLTVGAQLGGQTFEEIIVFRDEAALDRFKSGRFAFAADASAVLVKAGAAGAADPEREAAVFVSSEGGMMLAASIGAQKFIFRPAVLGRLATAETATRRRQKSGVNPLKKKTRPRHSGKTTRPNRKSSKPVHPRQAKTTAKHS
jgi:lipid-binding SYLF domain-containing protein